jgi:hypothetical protein
MEDLPAIALRLPIGEPPPFSGTTNQVITSDD